MTQGGCGARPASPGQEVLCPRPAQGSCPPRPPCASRNRGETQPCSVPRGGPPLQGEVGSLGLGGAGDCGLPCWHSFQGWVSCSRPWEPAEEASWRQAWCPPSYVGTVLRLRSGAQLSPDSEHGALGSRDPWGRSFSFQKAWPPVPFKSESLVEPGLGVAQSQPASTSPGPASPSRGGWG